VPGGRLQLESGVDAALRIQPGYSGSPVCDENGLVLGMVAAAAPGRSAERDSYVIAADDLRAAWPQLLDAGSTANHWSPDDLRIPPGYGERYDDESRFLDPDNPEDLEHIEGLTPRIGMSDTRGDEDLPEPGWPHSDGPVKAGEQDSQGSTERPEPETPWANAARRGREARVPPFQEHEDDQPRQGFASPQRPTGPPAPPWTDPVDESRRARHRRPSRSVIVS
jgi:hypothetical protein